MDDMDAGFDHILDATAEKVAHNAQRMDRLLDTLQDKLSRDYMVVPMVIGTGMIVGGFVHIGLQGEFVFSLASMIWGALIVFMGVFFRTRITQNLVVFSQALTELDRDRNDHARKLAVIRCLFDQGIPNGLSLHHLLVLLGEHNEKRMPRNDGPSPEHN